MKMPKVRTVKRMGQAGHYKPPTMKLPGLSNMPRRGRLGKTIQFSKMNNARPKR